PGKRGDTAGAPERSQVSDRASVSLVRSRHWRMDWLGRLGDGGRIAATARLVDEVDETAKDVGVGLGVDAVPQVEDVARPSPRGGEDRPGLGLDLRPRPQEEPRVEVALDGSILADPPPAVGEVDPPVEADDVAAGHR